MASNRLFMLRHFVIKARLEWLTVSDEKGLIEKQPGGASGDVVSVDPPRNKRTAC